jgi:hypothetical protein
MPRSGATSRHPDRNFPPSVYCSRHHDDLGVWVDSRRVIRATTQINAAGGRTPAWQCPKAQAAQCATSGLALARGVDAASTWPCLQTLKRPEGRAPALFGAARTAILPSSVYCSRQHDGSRLWVDSRRVIRATTQIKTDGRRTPAWQQPNAQAAEHPSARFASARGVYAASTWPCPQTLKRSAGRAPLHSSLS